MLTVCNLNIAAGDDEAALAQAGELLEPSLSPDAFTQPDGRATANSMWLGSAEALRRFGVRRGAEVLEGQAALVLQGRHTATNAEVVPARNGMARSYDVTFWAPESLAWVWAQSDERLRAQIEHAVLDGADYSVQYLTQSGLNGAPALGHAAPVVLHVTTPDVDEKVGVPRPVLHAHSCLVAVLGADKILRAPDGAMLFGNDAIFAAGAAGRLVLAEEIGKLGFGIEAQTGPKRRYFEVAGVPKNLLSSNFWARAKCTRQPVLRG
jgi:hypothetical protein